jgi:selenoprotein W-related protein
MPVSPMIEITYCRLCGWGLRAGWVAQELLTTFAEELGSVTLTPDATGGVFEVRAARIAELLAPLDTASSRRS